MDDKSRFYAALKRKDSGVFGTRLSQKQVDSLNVIVDEAARRDLPLRDLAYALATTYHEVGSARYNRTSGATAAYSLVAGVTSVGNV